MRIDYMIQSLDNLHRYVVGSRTRKPQSELERHNKRTGIRHANFQVGDFVLVADRESHSGSKLAVKWKGPRRVTRYDSQLVFEVEDLLNETRSFVHANRLNYYADSQLAVTESLLDTIDQNETHYNTVIKLLGLRFNQDRKKFEVQCEWRGFAQKEPTWEPFQNMREDIPDMLDKSLQTHANQELVDAARAG